MRYGFILLALLLMSGCSTDLKLRFGSESPKQMCDEYVPPQQEIPPLGVDPELLPYEDLELVAIILGGEIRALRDYIRRRDRRDRLAYDQYRLSCAASDKSLQPPPTK